MDVKPHRSTTTPGAIFTLAAVSAAPMIHSGCEEVALLGRPALDARSRAENAEFIGTVEELDHNRQELYLRTEGGQSQIVTYTERTQVTVDNQETLATGIRRGDTIAVRMHGTADGRVLADTIRLRERGNARNTTIEGTIEQVLRDRAVIELRTVSGALTTVYLPRNSAERTEEEFSRLRAGDFVRLRGIFLGENRFELIGVLGKKHNDVREKH